VAPVPLATAICAPTGSRLLRAHHALQQPLAAKSIIYFVQAEIDFNYMIFFYFFVLRCNIRLVRDASVC
jgi:hypothetical protein